MFSSVTPSALQRRADVAGTVWPFDGLIAVGVLSIPRCLRDTGKSEMLFCAVDKVGAIQMMLRPTGSMFKAA